MLEQDKTPYSRIALSITCNHNLPNAKETTKKQWDILKIKNLKISLQNHQFCVSVEIKTWKIFLEENYR